MVSVNRREVNASEELFTIIVPCREITPLLLKNLRKYRDVKLIKRSKILILPNSCDKETEAKVKEISKGMKVEIIPTHTSDPSSKRNLGVKLSKTPYLAMIDDDAYPEKNWLINSIKYLEKDDVGVVGGPNLTPPDSSAREVASGIILSSKLGAGELSLRYRQSSSVIEVDELPSCNLIVRRSILEKVGGFREDIWPGEDSIFCYEVRKKGYRIVYAPDVVVYHYRKPLLLPHLKQIWRYGFHRGMLARVGTPIRPIYVVPSILVVGLTVGAIFAFFSTVLRIVYLTCLTSYILSCLAFSLKKNIKILTLIFIGLILTHITYGVAFITGLLSYRRRGHIKTDRESSNSF